MQNADEAAAEHVQGIHNATQQFKSSKRFHTYHCISNFILRNFSQTYYDEMMVFIFSGQRPDPMEKYSRDNTNITHGCKWKSGRAGIPSMDSTQPSGFKGSQRGQNQYKCEVSLIIAFLLFVQNTTKINDVQFVS